MVKIYGENDSVCLFVCIYNFIYNLCTTCLHTKQIKFRVCNKVHDNKHERNHALLRSSASGFTQRGTARWTMRRSVMTVFHAVL